MAQEVPSNGIRVTLIEMADKKLSSDIIKFRGSRFFFTVEEILKHFSIDKLRPGEKIWIKRRDTTECLIQDFEKTARLTGKEFNDCIIAIAENRPSGASLLAFNVSNAAEDPKRTYEESVEEQVKLWKEKARKKEERFAKPSRTVEIKKQLIQVIVRKKRKARLEKEKPAGAGQFKEKENEEKKDPEN